METVYRLALIVRPKRRFVEWVNQLEDDEGPPLDLDNARSRPSIYLVNADPNTAEEDPKAIIDEYAVEIFENELEMWWTDEEAWPPNRTPHVFRDWFDVGIAEGVFDCDDGVDLTYPFDELEPGDIDPETGNVMVEADAFDYCSWCGKPTRDNPVVTVTLPHQPDVEQPPPGIVEMPLGSRTIRVVIPSPQSAAAVEGIAAMIMLCGDECAEAVRRALKTSRRAFNS